MLSNKSVIAVSGAYGYRAALCADGTVATWGSNSSGQLGNNSYSDSKVPVAVNASGVLSNKQVVAISTGATHMLALCADGTVTAWGSNSEGQLGNNSSANSKVPVAVEMTSVLANKRVVAVAAGDGFSLALCSDGTLAAWGSNSDGELGNNSVINSAVPVLVDSSGLLAGKRVAAIAAGGSHCLALCTDGTLAAWGYNNYGQLGDNSLTTALVPVAVTRNGLLSGKTITAISAGGYHSLALCADGTLASWGCNNSGQLGNNGISNSMVPVAVIASGVLADKTVRTVTAGNDNNFAMCSNGTMVAWGISFLGNNSASNSNVPVAVATSNLPTGACFISPGSALGLVATPPTDLTPAIADGTSLIGTNPTLAWTPDPFASSYRIYLGTDRDAVANATETSPQYLGSSLTPAWSGPTPALMAGGSYFWRVDTVYNGSIRPGKVWSFHISPVEIASSISHVAVKGMAAQIVATPISSSLTEPQPWSASLPGAPAWLSLIASAGSTPDSLRLRFDPAAVTAGTYTTVVRVVAGTAACQIPVQFTVPALAVTKLLADPVRQTAFGLNSASAGESFSRLLEIDAANGNVLRSLPIGANPVDADLDPTGGKIYVVNSGSSQCRVIDVVAWTELPSIPLGAACDRVEVTPDERIITESAAQWAVMKLWNATTGAQLAFASSIRTGDGQADPSGTFYYHCDSNSSAAAISKYSVANDTIVKSITGPVIDSGSRNLLLSSDGKKLFWMARSWDTDLHALARLPGEVYATNSTGELAVGTGSIWWSDSGTLAAALPFSSTVAAVSANDAYLLRYNPTTQTILSTPLAYLTNMSPLTPRPGQELATSPQRLSWPPVAGATSYQVFIATDAAALATMTTPVATVATSYYDLPAELGSGSSYCWRIDAVTGGGIAQGSVWSFVIRFSEGPAVPGSSGVNSGVATSLSSNHLLVGINDTAQLYAFDSATGTSSPLQAITRLPNMATSVALDADTAAVGAYAYEAAVLDSGAAYLYRPTADGYWETSGPLTPPSPVTSEAFGTGLAASGNMLLIGTGFYFNTRGRVAAYVTEPATVCRQVFSANDAIAGDQFGSVIAIDGNQAVISAPGRGLSYTRVGCLYAFSRSVTTGLWTQTQKIAIPGATTAGGSGKALALAGKTLATNSDAGTVVIYTRNDSGQWVQSATINRTNVPNSSSSFGCALALSREQLFIGDSAATQVPGSHGAVFGFRRSNETWVAIPTITPRIEPASAGFASYGGSLAARDSWLLVAGGSGAPAGLFRVNPTANQTPHFTPGIPTQVVAGRPLAATIHAEDADGNNGLVLEKLEGPAWLTLTDLGNGDAVLSGTPLGNSGDVSEVQLRVHDGAEAEALYTYQLTVLAASDLPNFTLEPLDVDTSAGRELVLRAAVSGVGPFLWQWYRDGNPISGATRPTLVLEEIALADAGHYSVRVSNGVGERLSTAAVVTVHPATRSAGDWETFGCLPSHTGHHPAALTGYAFAPVWSASIRPGHALNRAAIGDGKAYVTPWNAVALDLETGSTLWSHPFAAGYSVNPPTYHNGRVYIQRSNHSSDTQLWTLDSSTGATVWSTPHSAQWYSYEAPAVTENGIWITGGYTGGMFGISVDGTQRFFHDFEGYDQWTPTVAYDRLFSWVAGTFQEHNPADGASNWLLDAGWKWDGWSMNTVAAVAGDTAMILNRTEAVCIDLRTRTIRWRTTGTFTGSPAIGSGRAYAILGNAVCSYALRDGTPGPVFQTTASPEGLIEQPIIFNDRLLISDSAKTWVFDLADGRLLQTINAGGRLSYSNGYLLAAGTDGILRAFVACSNNAQLAGLVLNTGTMVPDFAQDITSYIATVPFATASTTITARTDDPTASLIINDQPAASGLPSGIIDLAVGNNTITTLVTAEDGSTTKSYTVTVTRLPLHFTFHSPGDIPVTADGFAADGIPVNIVLDYVPSPGTVLTMVNNIGTAFIHGSFGNLTQGQRIGLMYAGKRYDFAVNYCGGTGNDLVLQWADTQLASWGSNSYGQLGDGTTTRRLIPAMIDETSLLADKTITAIAEGYLHSLALCSDGTLAAWGYNVYGQLGNGSNVACNVPVAVDRSGALADKTVIAISAGPFHNLALCSDGTVAAWGYNNYGQLGTGDKATCRVPVRVHPVGALAGKDVVAVAAAAYASFALCADGTLVAWGYNDEGELGDGTTSNALVPVAVDPNGVLAGKRISSVAAGQYHTLALCTDGSLVAWGYNNHGQVGDGTTTSAMVPMAITSNGALAGKTVLQIRASGAHSMALCTDGTLATWGWNNKGQLGVTDINQSSLPIAVDTPAVAQNTRITEVAVGGNHSLALCANNIIAACGDNVSGQLGNGSTTGSAIPVTVDLSSLTADAGVMFVASSSAAQHNLAVLGMRLPNNATAQVADLSDSPLADSDLDGIPSLIAYAFGLSGSHSTAALPQPRKTGDKYAIQFSQPAGVSGLTYGAEWSATLQPGTWTNIPDTGSGNEHVFLLPDGLPKVFTRLRVMQP